MTGHQPIIAMRLAKVRPESVFLSNVTYMTDDWHLYRNPWTKQFNAQVAILDTDKVNQLDLRFLVGLQVHVTGFESMARTQEVFEAVKKAGARPCVGMYDDGYDYFFEMVTDANPH